MDFLTVLIRSLDNPLLTWLSLVIHHHVYLLSLLLIAASAPFFLKKKSILKVFFGLFFLFLVLTWLKGYYQEPRPCGAAFQDLPPKISCPPASDFAFPSGHVAMTFFLAAAVMGTGVFLPFYALASFTAFSRVYLGVHSVIDASGGIVLGLVVFTIADKLIDALVEP